MADPFMMFDWPNPTMRGARPWLHPWHVNLLQTTLSLVSPGTDSTARLTAAVSAVCPILSLNIGIEGDPNSVRISFAPSATLGQQISAYAVVAAFDWSATGTASFDTLQLREAAQAALADPAAAFKLTRGVLGVLIDEVNTLRTLHGLSTYTLAQAKALVSTKIDAGTVDT